MTLPLIPTDATQHQKKSAWYYRLSTPKFFLPFVLHYNHWLYLVSWITFFIGLWFGLVASPMDYQQGNSVRIMYIHVPAAMLSSALYSFMAVMSLIFLVWRIKLAVMLARNAAVIGASLTFITLVTGAIWGKPTWGTWWQWDMRLTSALILLLLYCGYIALANAFEETEKADRAISLLALIGIINIPLIKFSVYWFNTLHQKSTLFSFGKSTITAAHLTPLLIMLCALSLFCLANLLQRTANYIIAQDIERQWSALSSHSD